MCKYAYDMYIIIPASNEMTRHAELTNVQKWAEQKQPQAELPQVNRGHLQRQQVTATPHCGR